MTHIVVVDDDTPGRTTERQTVAGFECMVQQRLSVLDPTRVITTRVVRSGVHTISVVTDSGSANLAEHARRVAWLANDNTATAVRAVIRDELRKAGR